jgi:hypothetical protein
LVGGLIGAAPRFERVKLVSVAWRELRDHRCGEILRQHQEEV